MTPDTTQPLDPFKFYSYRQNNSGGRWEDNMPLHLYVEAASPEIADAIAESRGVYFEGCDNGQDCSCCGDRWSRAYGSGMTEEEVERDIAHGMAYAVTWKGCAEGMSPAQVVYVNAVVKTYKWPEGESDE